MWGEEPFCSGEAQFPVANAICIQINPISLVCLLQPSALAQHPPATHSPQPCCNLRRWEEGCVGPGRGHHSLPVLCHGLTANYVVTGVIPDAHGKTEVQSGGLPSHKVDKGQRFSPWGSSWASAHRWPRKPVGVEVGGPSPRPLTSLCLCHSASPCWASASSQLEKSMLAEPSF